MANIQESCAQRLIANFHNPTFTPQQKREAAKILYQMVGNHPTAVKPETLEKAYHVMIPAHIGDTTISAVAEGLKEFMTANPPHALKPLRYFLSG